MALREYTVIIKNETREIASAIFTLDEWEHCQPVRDFVGQVSREYLDLSETTNELHISVLIRENNKNDDSRL